jgi:hypothetical protein
MKDAGRHTLPEPGARCREHGATWSAARTPHSSAIISTAARHKVTMPASDVVTVDPRICSGNVV